MEPLLTRRAAAAAPRSPNGKGEKCMSAIGRALYFMGDCVSRLCRRPHKSTEQQGETKSQTTLRHTSTWREKSSQSFMKSFRSLPQEGSTRKVKVETI